MARGLIAERTRLSLFVLRRAMRTFGGRMNGHPLLRWRFAYARPDRLLIAPQDLRTADSTRASEIYSGRFAFAGKIVTCDGRSPFEMTPPSTEWAEGLLGFSWLRHLRAAESAITRSNARALVDDWITVQGAWDAVAWRPEIVARRIVSWLTHAPFLLHDADMRFYRRFMRSLTQQVRYLRRTTGDMRDGLPRLQGIIALNFAALCMAGQLRLLKSAARKLADELNRQVLPDGGHISRNPGALIELLLDLLPLRQAFGARNIPPPQPVINAIDRMMPMLRFFRHGNGAFANFNGMGPTPLDVLATVLAYDDARGRPVNNAAHSGYQRLEGGGSVLIMDSGAAPPMGVSHEAHAGCLAFEFSTQSQRIIVNCGLPGTSRDSWRHLSRTTPAHSTATLNENSSCRFFVSGSLPRLVGQPILDGPEKVTVEREEDASSTTVRVVHDGYAARFGMVHERLMSLSQDGKRLDGEDGILPVVGDNYPARVPDRYALRFHLHPSIRANRLTHRRGIMLTLPNREVWSFVSQSPMELEESVYLAGTDGPRRTVQIVIHGNAREAPRQAWTLIQVSDPNTRSRVGEEAELPL
jgi:uncharacterized heparinase superfamily protein